MARSRSPIRRLPAIVWSLGIILVVAISGLAWHQYRLYRENENREQVKAWMDSTVIPRFELQEQSFDDAIALLNQIIDARPSHPQGLHIVVAPPEETQKRFRPLVRLPSIGSKETSVLSGASTPSKWTRDTKRTFAMKDASISEVFLYLRPDFGSTEIRGRTVVVHVFPAPGTIDRLVTREFQLRSHAPFSWSRSVDLNQPGEIDLRDYFSADGISIVEGSFALYDTATRRLRIRLTSNDLDLAETFLTGFTEPSLSDRVWWTVRYQLHDRWVPPKPFPPLTPLDLPDLENKSEPDDSSSHSLEGERR